MKQVLECCLLSLSLFLFFSCGKEEEGPIPTDRQVPIGVMEASLSTRVSTRGVINTDIYKLGISVRTLRDIHLSMMLPIVTKQPVGRLLQKYWWITVRRACTHIILISLYPLPITLRRRFWLPGFMMQLKICVTVPLRLQMDQA